MIKQIQETKKPVMRKEEKSETLIRILSTDIPSSRNVYSGLTRIKGISFSISNAICHILKLNKNKRIGELTKEEITTITEIVKNLNIPKFLMNRQSDYDDGKNKHFTVTNLELRKEFDIKRLKKIRSYKGVRHSYGYPVRGQRTRSHFRKRGKHKSVGVKTKKIGSKG